MSRTSLAFGSLRAGLASSASPAVVSRRERVLVAALATFAALRVALFAGAFPFFANIDEHMHFDMVLKYARGYLPEPGRDAFEPSMREYLALYGTPEYLLAPGEPAPAPVWRRPIGGLFGRMDASERLLHGLANKEAEQPPIYYATAGIWLRFGRALGLDGARLLYFVRSLAAVVAFAFVWVAFGCVREPYRDDALVRLGVPLLAAVFPQDTFFYVTSDVPSPLLGGLAFALSLRLASRPESSAALHAACGALLGAALLTKWTSAALLVVAAAAGWHALAHTPRSGPRCRLAAKLVLQWGLVLLPVLLWCGRNLRLYGDATGTALKIGHLGWQLKPPSDWLAHPIFTPAGMAVFVADLIATFWRGELAWHRTDLALPAMDALYTGSTLLLLALALVGLRGREPRRFLAEGLALLAVAAATAILAALSLAFAFAFGASANPSASHPYFAQGRLISGVLLPLLLVYVRGLGVAAGWLPARVGRAAAWASLVALALAVLLSELALTWPVFASEYNAFHLP